MNRMTKALGGLLLAAVLAACGGGGGSAGTNPNAPAPGTPGTPTTDPSTPVVASLIYQLSKTALTNSGSDTSVLTVTALDANNNPIPNVPLTVSVDTGVYTPTKAATGTDGQAGGAISIGANKANRNITATIRLGGQTTTAVIAVAGSALTLTPLPATPAPGQSVRVDLKVTDANGTGVPNVPVALSGTLGFTGSVTTDLNGNATATLGAAPSAAGNYTVDAAALGVTATRTVQVVAGGGGGIPNATGPVSSASLAIVPNTIGPNTTGSTTNRAGLRAKFINASNQAIPNVRVRFQIDAPGLGAGEQLSTGTTTVYSDVNGDAIADYIPGTRSSPTNGVTIRACYGLTDADLAGGACPNSVIQTLTVASQPLSVTLGDNNLLERGNNSLTYIKKFDVAVVDAAGNAVANANVSASVDLVSYAKGRYIKPVAPSTTPTGTTAVCTNEDTNRNGALDAGEDVNGDGELDPRKADVALSFVGSNVTGTNGRMTIQVEYPQNVATWLEYTVRVTTNVAGSEGTDSKTYVTTFIQGDDTNGSFLLSPYGQGLTCADPN
jgi:hypothetical protein